MPIASNKRSARLGFDYFWSTAGNDPTIHYFFKRLQNYISAHGFVPGYCFVDERVEEFRVSIKMATHKRFLKPFGLGGGSRLFFSVPSTASNRYKKYITRQAKKAQLQCLQALARSLLLCVIKYVIYVYVQRFTSKPIVLDTACYDALIRRYPYFAWSHRYLFYTQTRREQMEAYVNSLSFGIYFEDHELVKNVVVNQWSLKKKNIVFLKQTSKYIEQLAPLNVLITGFSLTACGKMNGALRASKKIVKFGDPVAEETFRQSLVELSGAAQTYTGTFGLKMHILLNGGESV
jgi:hypothetical protein